MSKEETVEKITKGGIRCDTVGELKEIMKDIPDDLEIDFEQCEVVWYNYGSVTGFLGFREPDC